MSEDAEEQILASMSENDLRVPLAGALASQNAPIAVLQFLRLVRQSKHESRRLIFSEDALESWLGEVSSDPEKTRLAEFLSELVEVEKRPGLTRTECLVRRRFASGWVAALGLEGRGRAEWPDFLRFERPAALENPA
jgi:hypothetical protein